MRSATAVVLSELLMPRLFPWHFGHTQIAFTPFVQIAGLGGAMAVTFLMFWLAEVVVRFVVFRERRAVFGLPVVLFGLAMAYGAAMMSTFRSPPGRSQDVVLVQGNATLAEKRDLASAQRNLARIFDLSTAATHPGTLIVWPEGSVPAYIPATVGAVGYPPILPWIGDGSAFLVGSYSFLPNEERFNAAFAVYPDGTVPFPYFKRVLIPFGEYLPLASYFPVLKTLNAKAGVFTAGTEAQVFAYPLHQPDGTPYTLKVSPLICYEDTVPALARESDAERRRAAGQHHVRLLVRTHPGPAPASPDRGVPSDREPSVPDPRDQYRLQRDRLSPGQDHREDSPIHRRDCHGEGELARLPKCLYLLDRRPALVDAPGVERGHDRGETLARDRVGANSVTGKPSENRDRSMQATSMTPGPNARKPIVPIFGRALRRVIAVLVVLLFTRPAGRRPTPSPSPPGEKLPEGRMRGPESHGVMASQHRPPARGVAHVRHVPSGELPHSPPQPSRRRILFATSVPSALV